MNKKKKKDENTLADLTSRSTCGFLAGVSGLLVTPAEIFVVPILFLGVDFGNGGRSPEEGTLELTTDSGCPRTALKSPEIPKKSRDSN